MKMIPKLGLSNLNGEFLTVKKRSGRTSFELHRHDYYEILMYKNCNGCCILNGKEYAMSGDSLFLLTPKDYHKIINIENQSSYSINVSFSENIVNKTLLTELGFVPRVMTKLSEETVYCMEMMLKYYTEKSRFKDIKLNGMLSLLITSVLENSVPSKESTGFFSSQIRETMAYILSDLTKSHKLEDVAKISGLSAPYFSHLFHKETGKPYKRWLTTVRIDYAKRIIEDKDASIIDICYECGYNTPSQFLKMFKRETSMTPTEYRKLFAEKTNQNE